MSEAASAPAEDIDALSRSAAVWIERRDFGVWGEDEQAQFDAWLSASPAHRIAYLRMEAGWKRTELLGALRPFKAERKSRSAASGSRALLMKLAASIALLGAIGAGTAYYFVPKPQIYATGVGGRETLRLSDGTLIDLNTDTRVRLSGVRGERMVWLEKGEAYFQVKHDPAHPFMVIAANRRVTDIRSRSFTLTPGDVVVATAHSVAVSVKSQQDLVNELGWRRGVLIFRHTALGEAVAEFNRYNNRKLILTDPELAGRTIGGAFTVTDVERFAMVLREALGLNIHDRNGDIAISR